MLCLWLVYLSGSCQFCMYFESGVRAVCFSLVWFFHFVPSCMAAAWRWTGIEKKGVVAGCVVGIVIPGAQSHLDELEVDDTGMFSIASRSRLSYRARINRVCWVHKHSTRLSCCSSIS